MKNKIVVTGGSGKLGPACVRDLIDHGYQVFVVDRVNPPAGLLPPLCDSIVADLTDYGETIDAISSVNAGEHNIYAVVHLAAIPAPRLRPNAHTFRNNTLSDYNVFEACRRLQIRNVVWASSETVLGLPFDAPPPYVPVDEDCPARPESAYSLSKLLSETMAGQFCRWDPQLKMIGLRFSNVMEESDYARFESFQRDSAMRKWNLWSYIDARDAAQAIRKSIEATITGAEVFIIANADSVMARPNADLLAEHFANVPHKRPFGPNDTLLAIEKARRVLGFEPVHGWRKAMP